MTAPLSTASQRLSIEFVVKPTEDLFLEGSLRRIPRVSKGEAYPCQMQKNQSFSCLFRHYAKHNGLRKDDLVFTFVDELLPDQTPETVHLMPADEIYVSLRQHIEPPCPPVVPAKSFQMQFKKLLQTGLHSDVSFILEEGKTCIQGHRAILSARSDFFDAMLRVGGMSESLQNEITINHDVSSFRRMLEFIYTDEIADIKDCTADEVMQLLNTASQYVMDDLRIYTEPLAAKLLAVDNIANFMLLSVDKENTVLLDSCIRFISEHKQDLASDSSFYKEVENNPELGLLLFKYAVNGESSSPGFFSSSDDFSRKRKRSEITILQDASSQQANSMNTIAQSNASVQDLF